MLIVMQIFLKTVFQSSTSSCIEARFTDIFRHGELLEILICVANMIYMYIKTFDFHLRNKLQFKKLTGI